jgi:hypothetical protein
LLSTVSDVLRTDGLGDYDAQEERTRPGKGLGG